MNVLAAEMADPVCPSSKQKDLTRLFTEPGSTCNKWNLTFFPPDLFGFLEHGKNCLMSWTGHEFRVLRWSSQTTKKKIHHFEWLSRTTQRGLVVCFLDMFFFQGVFPAETNARKPASCPYKNCHKTGGNALKKATCLSENPAVVFRSRGFPGEKIVQPKSGLRRFRSHVRFRSL